MKLVSLFISLLVANVSWGSNLTDKLAFDLQARTTLSAKLTGLNWHVGDKAEYNLKMAFFEGTAVMKVASETNEGFWLNQDIDLGPLGQQKAEMLIDKNTGKILQYKVNGQDQQIPDQGDVEVLETSEANITVPAGSFDCMYVKMKDGEGQIIEMWVNPTAVPIMGLIKNVSPSQLGEVTLELTGFDEAD